MRHHKQQGSNYGCSQICVRLDRIQFRAHLFLVKLLLLAGFVRMRDHFVMSQTWIVTYRRVVTYRHPRTRTTVAIQYSPACTWLWPFKVTGIPDDQVGFCRDELERIFGAFRRNQLLTAELALDFSSHSGVDRDFILRHGIFGKSLPVGNRIGDELRYGSRYSVTMVRAYQKPEIRSYRVEVELRKPWLHRQGIQKLTDLQKLHGLLVPSRIRFVSIDWHALARQLSRKGVAPDPIMKEAQRRAHSIHRALHYVRSKGGITNAYRLLVPLPINRKIQSALITWAHLWSQAGEK
jgi:hypothetical protein